jgi:hypothetical protein
MRNPLAVAGLTLLLVTASLTALMRFDGDYGQVTEVSFSTPASLTLPVPATLDQYDAFEQAWPVLRSDLREDDAPELALSRREYLAGLSDIVVARGGFGPSLVGARSPSRAGVGAPVVLAVSDSFGFGAGLPEIGRAWPEQLSEELDRRNGVGSYEVMNTSMIGASWMEYAEWLSDERLAEIDPAVVVVGYYVNDPIPSGRESSICGADPFCSTSTGQLVGAYSACLRGEYGRIGRFISLLTGQFTKLNTALLSRYCDMSRLADRMDVPSLEEMQSRPELNPYLDAFDAATARFSEIAQRVPLVVVPLTTGVSFSGEPTDERLTARRYLDRISAAGLEVLDRPEMPQTEAAIARTDLSERRNSSFDPHASPLMGRALAADIAAVIAQRQPGSATGAGNPLELTAVTRDTYPFSIARQVVSTQDTLTETLATTDPTSLDWYTQSLFGGPGSHDYAPCLAMDRPHARLPFAAIPDGRRTVTLRLEDSFEKNVNYRFYGYDADGRETYTEMQALKRGQSVTVAVDDARRGVLIGGNDAGCSISPWIAPPFRVSLTTQR